MLRSLSTVLEDLHAGMQAATRRAGHGVRIAQAEMTLPMDCALVLADSGCTLLADVARNPADASWRESASRLVLRWGEIPTEELP
ncbi:hypothetical protein [Cupriavidus sp. DF5525]|uniref:hypothetical protein n=1 Tax=Cupriavidus sp. DF5525 TaxID=3160989 RepID=UPI0032DE6DBC